MFTTTTTKLAAAIRRIAVTLYDFQQVLTDAIYAGWNNGADNMLAVLPTGGGKTVVFAGILANYEGYSCAVAHRQELVSQISMALARNHVHHRIIAQRDTVTRITRMHVEELGVNYVDPRSNCAVAGVGTLTSSKQINDPIIKQWALRVGLWVMDEAHHVLKNNQWGKAVSMFPNARGLGVTATPTRADGKGLGSEWDGVFDEMVLGPSMRELITRGFLTDYTVFCPPSDLDLSHVKVSEATGDYVPQQLKVAVRNSSIIGDVVRCYLQFAQGKLGVTFAPDVETATDMARKYNEAGVPAEVVSANTPDEVRAEILRRFKARKLLQLVNVDLFGEGFDLPAIEVVSFARPTESLSLYMQQFGRALRKMAGKALAIIIDHVGNIVRHRLPDILRVWTLAPREKRSAKKRFGEIPMKTCTNKQVLCFKPYEAYLKSCPYCGHTPVPAQRSAPEFVDGDLIELDAETLAKLRGDVAKVDGPALIPRDANQIVAASIKKNHRERQDAQATLRACIQWWAGMHHGMGHNDSECYRIFFFRFGIDVLTASALGRPEAMELAHRISEDIGRIGAGVLVA